MKATFVLVEGFAARKMKEESAAAGKRRMETIKG
jgi:hypothetical protein